MTEWVFLARLYFLIKERESEKQTFRRWYEYMLGFTETPRVLLFSLVVKKKLETGYHACFVIVIKILS